MKKTRFLALTLVVAIALMGAGYAAWMDVLKVDATVKTGYLDVDFTNVESETSSEWVEVTHNYITALNDDNETGPTADKDKVVFKIKNLYPGAWVEETVTFENKGTMPVKVSDMFVKSPDGDPTTLAYMIVTTPDGEEHRFEDEIVPLWFWECPKHLLRPCPKDCKYKYPTCPEDPPVEPADLILEPGESMDYTVRFKLDEHAPDNDTEVKDVIFELTINFTQYNLDDSYYNQD